MTQVPENDKKAPKEKAPKDRDDHHDDANPMPDTHHVNRDSGNKKSDNDRKKDH